MTSPTQGEHAQTEALRPKFGDLLRNTMASESNPRRDAYFIREVHRSGGGVNPGRWFEMTDGKGETWLSNPQNMVSAAPAQPAAEGAAKVNWWEANGDKYDASISPMQPAPATQQAGWKLVPLEPSVDQEWEGKEASRRVDSMAEACKIYKAMLAAAPQPTPAAQADSVLEDAASAGFFLQLPQRPKPEAPAGTVGLDWDAYSGAQMLAFGRDCSNAAIVATQKPGGA
ncbi:hypothetical protein ACFOW3_13760 [Acidovorax facilis]|uniref:Uncharacterized protein n=1 Tax=Acidovorax facilis TaxID=12917 RepID=A0ABV8DBF1_9BURK